MGKGIDAHGMTAWDFIDKWLRSRRIVYIAMVGAVAALLLLWSAVHLVADPGKEISMLGGLIRYVKSSPTAVAEVAKSSLINDRSHALRIATYSGSLRINAVLNQDSSKKVWHEVLLSSRKIQPFDGFSIASAWVSTCYNNPNCANKAHEHLGAVVLNSGGKPIDDAYREAFASWWNGVAPTIDWRPEKSPIETNLDDVTVVGKNTIQFEIKPISSSWSVSVELLGRTSKTDPYSVLRSFSLSSDDRATSAGKADPVQSNILTFEK